MKKVRRHFSISLDVDESINELAEQNSVNKSFIVDRAIRYYIENEGRQYMHLYDVLDNMITPIHEELKRLRFATNSIDKDTKMLLEFWNHQLATSNVEEFISTERFVSEELEEVEKIVQKRVAEKRQKRLSD